ncbi:MAG TPA: hypothetical protein VN578_18205 [Candidatus Binatia bacterium]|jgi:hypothetical protein|nr:hypothetical protein [Candidatus Binatia bacterium]
MKKASGFYADSLEMLLDTMCNILGGVVFITLTLAVLVRNSPSKTPAQKEQQAAELTNQLTAVTRSNALTEAEIAMTVQHLQDSRPSAQTNFMHLPVEHETGKQSWMVIVSQGKLYPVQSFSPTARDNKTKNTRTIDWQSLGRGTEEATPKQGQGIEPESGVAEMVQTFRKNSKTNFYFAFLVKADSFAAFNRAKETAGTLGFQFGWDPFAIDEPIRLGLSRGEGQRILPQN